MSEDIYSIKEVSKMLDCSTQAIYQKKDKLIKSGLMEQSETGQYYINKNGLNYLRQIRTETIQASNKEFNQVDLQSLSSDKNIDKSINNEIISLLKSQLEELKTDRDYWKNEYSKQVQELSKSNEKLQELTTKAFALLETADEHRKREEENKKGFFKKFFN